jgi:hypothetical protein
MRYVKASNVPASEAEDLVAKIWITVEKHGLSSPKITICSKSTRLEIELLFTSERDASLVAAELPRLMVRNMRTWIIGGKFNGLSATVPGRHPARRAPQGRVRRASRSAALLKKASSSAPHRDARR